MKQKLNEKIQRKDLGEASLCLGQETIRNRSEGELYFTQKNYIQDVVEKFGVVERKPVATQLEEAKSTKDRLGLGDGDKTSNNPAVDAPHREATGSLLYLMTSTRLDIANAVSKLAQFCENPQQKYWTAVKRVLSYIYGTKKLGVVSRSQVSCASLDTVTRTGLEMSVIENLQVGMYL